MKIWVDADACPGAVKEILFRAAERTGIQVTLVANQTLRTPKSKFVRSVVVERTFDAADHWICANIEADDLVITADVPLAAEAVEAGATALNPRGELYTKDNVRERLNMRDMMEDLRSSGMVSGGPSTFGSREKQAFANQLDKYLQSRK